MTSKVRLVPEQYDNSSTTSSDVLSGHEGSQEDHHPSALKIADILQILSPLQQCGKDEGWFLDVIDACADKITQLVTRLPSSAKPHNARSKYKQGYHRSVLRCVCKHLGVAIKSKRATRNKQTTQFWALCQLPADAEEARSSVVLTDEHVDRCLMGLHEFLGDSWFRRVVFIDANGRFFTSLPRGRRVGVAVNQKMKEHVHRLAGGDPVVNGEFTSVTDLDLGLARVPRASLCVIGWAGVTDAHDYLAHACELADTMAFVLPAVFADSSSADSKRVDHRLHLAQVEKLKGTSAFCIYQRRYEVQDILRAVVGVAETVSTSTPTASPPSVRVPSQKPASPLSSSSVSRKRKADVVDLP